MNAKTIGEKIATRRKELGMTQLELANKVHVSNRAVSKWENGLNYPDLSLMAPIAQALEMSVVALMGLEDKTMSEAIQAATTISKEEKQNMWVCVRFYIIYMIAISALCGIMACVADVSLQQLFDDGLAWNGTIDSAIDVIRIFAILNIPIAISLWRLLAKANKEK